MRRDGFGASSVLAFARGRRRARGGARPQGGRDDPRGHMRGKRTRPGRVPTATTETFRNFPGDFRLRSTRSASTATGPRLRCCSPTRGHVSVLSTLAVYDVDTDGYRTFDFAITGRAPESHAWDAAAPNVLAAQTAFDENAFADADEKTENETKDEGDSRDTPHPRQSVRVRDRSRAERRDDEAARELPRRRGVHALRVTPRVATAGGASPFPTDSNRSSAWPRPRCSCATKPRRRAAAARASR